LEIIYFNEIESTQKYLLNNLKENICIWSEYQTNGIGSRGNSWIGEKGNLFFSFSIHKDKLPDDLLLQSISIYFMYQLKKLLKILGSKVKFKWPNDLYLKKKVGGCITNIKDDIIICGIGINTKSSLEYESLDIDIENKKLLKMYLEYIQNFPKWQEIFREFKEEFYKYSFIDAKLNNDGSITKDNERIYSLR
jgi:BirA family biotin operon repressor/biotin-[acetyl-CoA-carboxylase] ligase